MMTVHEFSEKGRDLKIVDSGGADAWNADSQVSIAQ